MKKLAMLLQNKYRLDGHHQIDLQELKFLPQVASDTSY